MRTPLSGLPVLFSLLAAGCSGPAPVAVNPPPDATPVVSEKPAIDTPGPVIRVTAAYPGASANVVTDTVAIPLEQSINGTEGLVLIESQMNSNGDYLATLHFAPKTDIKVAQVLVQNRVALDAAEVAAPGSAGGDRHPQRRPSPGSPACGWPWSAPTALATRHSFRITPGSS